MGQTIRVERAKQLGGIPPIPEEAIKILEDFADGKDQELTDAETRELLRNLAGFMSGVAARVNLILAAGISKTVEVVQD